MTGESDVHDVSQHGERRAPSGAYLAMTNAVRWLMVSVQAHHVDLYVPMC